MQEREEESLKSARRQAVQADVQWMQQVSLSEQLDKERKNYSANESSQKSISYNQIDSHIFGIR